MKRIIALSTIVYMISSMMLIPEAAYIFDGGRKFPPLCHFKICGMGWEKRMDKTYNNDDLEYIDKEINVMPINDSKEFDAFAIRVPTAEEEIEASFNDVKDKKMRQRALCYFKICSMS